MTVQVVKASEVPKPRRKSLPRIMKSPEWNLVHRQMLAGVKPDEVIVYTLTAAELEEYKVKNIQAAARAIKTMIQRSRGLLPFTVSAQTTADGGVIILRPKINF